MVFPVTGSGVTKALPFFRSFATKAFSRSFTHSLSPFYPTKLIACRHFSSYLTPGSEMRRKAFNAKIPTSRTLLGLFIIGTGMFTLTMEYVHAQEDVSLKNISSEKRLMIQLSVQAINESFFSFRGMQLSLLQDCPQAIPTLVQWIYDDWHTHDATLTKEKLYGSFMKRLSSSEDLPITLVILKEKVPVGTIALKQERASEFADFPETALWIGSLHVVLEERDKGVGTELLKFVSSIAKKLGQDKLYVYTTEPRNVPWYCKRGVKVLEKRPFRGQTATVMCIPLR
ncbi:MAG: GNAT family N-acetyltransferase [Ignavibacteriae bacterium]|nr:GNAT family N-acetyltransferase [Ignavibacteriota bacterium]